MNANATSFSKDVEVTWDTFRLPGHLKVPADCRGVVLFAHGSGSSRFSIRNRQVAAALNETGLGTFLFDLLTPDEAQEPENVFDIPLLASRLLLATRTLQGYPVLRGLPVGYFGASTGGSAALLAAASLKGEISAVVSRGGRPDLAMPRLSEVTAPTLLIVGSEDSPVLQMNEEALKYLGIGELAIVPGATHLFEEPGCLEEVAVLAQSWFLRFFKEEQARRRGRKTA